MTTETVVPKEMVDVNFNGQVITIEKDGRLHKQIQNLVEDTKAEAFADRRSMYLEAVSQVLDEQANGFEEVLDGQALIYDFSEDGPKLHRAELIKLGKRVGKKSE